MKNVLILSSKKTINQLVKQALAREFGYFGLVAENLARARLLVHQNPISLAVVSMVLPGEPDGQAVDFARERNIPCLVLTSFMDAALRTKTLSKGVLDYVLINTQCVANTMAAIRAFEMSLNVKLLLVDDSHTVRTVIREYLAPYGFVLLEAHNGRVGLDLLMANPDVKLVITDYEMPVMNGLEFCAAVRNAYGVNELPVIGVSSSDDELLSVQFIKHGANDFLVKPFHREDLHCRVMRSLETAGYIETIKAMNARMAKDLAAAATLQRSLLPLEMPRMAGVGAAAVYVPCEELSGDTYNIFLLDDDHLGVVLVDVSGHGVGAALLSVTLSHLLNPALQGSNLLREDIPQPPGYRILEPNEVCASLNESFQMGENIQYFTMVYGVLDLSTGLLSYCAAGHPPPILILGTEEPLTLETCGPPIGLIPAATYDMSQLQLQPGARLFFFTDGLIEAARKTPGKHRHGIELFGSERLSAKLVDIATLALEPGLIEVVEAVKAWSTGPPNDDLTLFALEYTGGAQQAVDDAETGNG